MIDAILYGIDRRGRIILREQAFHSLAEIARSFASDEADRWSWVEVEDRIAGGEVRCRRHSADEMRALAAGLKSAAALN